jgi:alpha-L-arabinofuranosidase
LKCKERRTLDAHLSGALVAAAFAVSAAFAAGAVSAQSREPLVAELTIQADHIFEIYKVHQDATATPIQLASPRYQHGGLDVPALSASASRDAAGILHLSLINLDPHRSADLAVKVAGKRITSATGRLLTASAMDAHNTFEQPHIVAPAPFNGIKLARGELALALPPKSVVVLRLE